MLDSNYHMTLKLFKIVFFLCENGKILVVYQFKLWIYTTPIHDILL